MDKAIGKKFLGSNKGSVRYRTEEYVWPRFSVCPHFGKLYFVRVATNMYGIFCLSARPSGNRHQSKTQQSIGRGFG